MSTPGGMCECLYSTKTTYQDKSIREKSERPSQIGTEKGHLAVNVHQDLECNFDIASDHRAFISGSTTTPMLFSESWSRFQL